MRFTMKSRLISLIIICTCFVAASAIAAEKTFQLSPEDKDKLTATAQNLALCSGVYDMVSEIHKMTNSPALSLNTHEVANGAEIAAAFLLASTHIIPDWQNALKYAASGRSLEKARQEALFAAEPRSFSEKISNNDDGGLSIEKCALLSEIQTELVNKAKSGCLLTTSTLVSASTCNTFSGYRPKAATKNQTFGKSSLRPPRTKAHNRPNRRTPSARSNT